MTGTHYETDYLIELFTENAKGEESLAILFVKSDMQLVINLQDCVKAQQSAAYANKVKLSNLKEMAWTVAYIIHLSVLYSVIIRTLLFQLFYMDNRSNTSSI